MDNEDKTSIGDSVLMIVCDTIMLICAIWLAVKSADDAFEMMLWCFLAAMNTYIFGRDIYRLSKSAKAKRDAMKIDGVSRGDDEDEKEEE